MSAGGAVLHHQFRQGLVQLPMKGRHLLHVLAQSFSQTFPSVAAQANGVVVVQLYIAEPVVFQKIHNVTFYIPSDPRVPEVPEPPGHGSNGKTIPFQQVFLLMISLSIRPHRFRLKPDAGNHSRLTDCLHRLFQPLGEQLLGNLPVSQSLIPGLVFRLVPPGIDDKVADGLPLQNSQNLGNSLLRGTSPAGAVLIEHDGQVPFFLHRIFRHQGSGHSLGSIQNTFPTANSQNCLRRPEGFSGLDGFPPVTELVIRQTAAEGQAVIRSVQFHLPGGIVGNLAPPEHPAAAVLHHQPGEPAVDRHGACLSKAKGAHPE